LKYFLNLFTNFLLNHAVLMDLPFFGVIYIPSAYFHVEFLVSQKIETNDFLFFWSQVYSIKGVLQRPKQMVIRRCKVRTI